MINATTIYEFIVSEEWYIVPYVTNDKGKKNHNQNMYTAGGMVSFSTSLDIGGNSTQ